MVTTLSEGKQDADYMVQQQKLYFDNFFSWEVRMKEWNQLLNTILWEQDERK
jgi:hypothetical protein